MPLVASTGPVLVRCCQHRPSTGPVLAHNGMFTSCLLTSKLLHSFLLMKPVYKKSAPQTANC